VDHGKSSLIVKLTGIDPDRWEEEKRRGLTIDLGFAWGTLPSGREVGFVDVPGHERFVRNMLAGVGPLRLVLFVVAADEGWKPQSEEHLAIIDVLGAHAGVVALSKADLVEESALRQGEEDVRSRLRGTTLESAPIVGCSSVTGAGIEELARALDEMLAAAPEPEDRGRPRIHIDRSFTIRGAGTVVTGTLAGGALAIGDEVEIAPRGRRARIRSLQTHRRAVDVARPIARVAANLTGTAKDEAERGDALVAPGQWRPTARLETQLRAIRGLRHAVTERGAYKLYAGTAERDARLRLYGAAELRTGEAAFARLTLSAPVVVEVGDRFVLREAGRRETVAGGVVLDADPPLRPGADAEHRLARRMAAAPDELPRIVVEERGVVRASDLAVLAGGPPTSIEGATRIGGWWVSKDAHDRLAGTLRSALAEYHRAHPLRPGLGVVELRLALIDRSPAFAAALEHELGTALLESLEGEGEVLREGTTVRLATHAVELGEQEPEAERLIAAVRDGEPVPPDVKELLRAGFSTELVDACAMTGRLVRVSDDLVFTPEFVREAEGIVRTEAARSNGLTVSRFRELLGTTRKYALPLLGYFDATGLTKRDGDVRRLAS
jgi:selenocysteine-specific elongation factor